MRVLHLRASDFYGGPERQLHFHARLALECDVRITVGSFTEGGQAPGFLEPMARDGIETHVFPVRSAYDPRAVARLRRLLTANGFDLICTHEYRSTVLGWLATRGTTTRWIAFSRGFTWTDAKVRLYQTFEKALIRRADRIVAVSAAQKQVLEGLRIDPRRISVVRNAIDVAAVTSRSPADLRARFGFAPDTLVGVAGGRFSQEKGQDLLVRAGAAAIERNPRIRLVLFGEGPDRSRTTELAKQLGVETRILCPGFETAILDHVAGADFLVNPSRSEGLPNIVLEGMALGVPVIATAVGGVPEIIEHGETGWLVPSNDPEALASAIVEATVDPGRNQEMVRRAREFVRGECSFEAQFDELRAIYEQVLR